MQLQSASPKTKIVLTGYAVPKGPLTWHPSAACSEFRALEPLNQLVMLGEKQGDFFNEKTDQFHIDLYVYCIIQIDRDIEFLFSFHLNKYFRGGRVVVVDFFIQSSIFSPFSSNKISSMI